MYTEEGKSEKTKGSGKIFSINYSKVKGVSKKPIQTASLLENFGLEGDAHGGPGLRQISLLAIESIRKQSKCSKVKNKDVDLHPGDFAENITTENINLARLKIGSRLKIGKDAFIEISKIGKECHKYCGIYYKIGDCIMPREGIFAKVLKNGEIIVGDLIEVDNV